MNSRLKTALIVLLALTTVATGIYAWQLNRALHGPQIGSADSDRAALEKRLADAEHRAHDLQNELDTLKARNVASDTQSDEPPGPPNNNDDRGGRFRGRGAEAFQAMMNDPKVVQLMNSREKMMLDSRYASLFKSLLQSGSGANMTPEQLDTFKNLLVEKQNTERDVRMSARAEGVTDRSEINKLVKSAQAEVDTQIQSTLGPDGFSQYQQYEKTAPQRNVVNQVAQSLSYTSAPLTDAQNQQLVQILANNASTDTNQRRNFGGGFGGGTGPTATVTDAAVSQASGVLTPAQMTALVAIKDQQIAQIALRDAALAAAHTSTVTTTSVAGSAGFTATTSTPTATTRKKP